MRHFIGIDIGGTGIAAAIVREDGEIIERAEVPTPKQGGTQVLDAAIALAQDLMAKSRDKIEGIGVAAGGQIDTQTGTVLFATEIIPGWTGMEITKGITKALRLPCRATNDVKAMALGECRFGAGRRYSKGSIVCLALGTGVGGAWVVDGAVYDGANFCGGHFGHMMLGPYPKGRRGIASQKGTLESYCSSFGLVQTWRDLTGEAEKQFTSLDVVAAARADRNGPAAQAITETGNMLGVALASLANMLDPHLFIIGGGLSELGDLLLAPARRMLQELALPNVAKCPVVVAERGADAQTIGAACLMMDPSRLATSV
jgi:glucokinase